MSFTRVSRSLCGNPSIATANVTGTNRAIFCWSEAVSEASAAFAELAMSARDFGAKGSTRASVGATA